MKSRVVMTPELWAAIREMAEYWPILERNAIERNEKRDARRWLIVVLWRRIEQLRIRNIRPKLPSQTP